MRILSIFFLMFSCLAYGQELNNPNKLKWCPKDQNARYHNCWGTFILSNGDKYVGEYKHGMRNGQGTYHYASGEKYVGEFKDGNPNGRGTYTFTSGNKYVGEFKGGNKHGQGTFTFTSGNKYVGAFKDNKFHGQGTFTYARGDKYVGEFKDGNSNGQGTFTFTSGNKYVGEFKQDKFHGLGTFAFAEGSKYVGEFKDDKFHGQGIYTHGDGSRKEGIWENDNFVREAKVDLPNLVNSIATNTERADIDSERRKLAEERRRLEEEKRQQQAENNTPKKQAAASDSRRRLALVIGNAAYKNSPLRNPTNDADSISNALSSSGFIVSRYDNLTYVKMREVVRIFGEKLNRGDVGLFYFSGHAVQYRGKNYLLPINEDLKHADEIPSTAMDIDFVLAKMETAKNDLNIVILDACRNNPLGSEARNLDRGLTTISAAKGTFIAFATSPGNVALDGTGRNSPYTKNLAQAILKGGLSLEQVFKEVRRNVISETNSQQVPWENSSILGDFYFK